VFGVLPIPPDFIRQQIEIVLDDLGADALKTGMLHDAAVIETVAAVVAERAAGIPLVLDPVMVAKGGAPLIEEGAIGALKRLLVPQAAVLTPNLPEAEILAGHAIPDLATMRGTATELLQLGCRAVLLKGGHLPGDTVYDVLATADGQRIWNSPRIHSRHTHGTGCTLASAIAAGLAQGLGIEAAVERAREYVQRAIASAPGLGHGHGPLDHAHPLRAH
jgi:hydroxymethylpyrimidine/phosphomethylpyrimidine kinase